MSWWLGSLTVRIRIYPLQNFLPTESRSADQLSAPEIILLEGHQLLQESEIFSVPVVGAQEIDVQSACSVRLPTKQATDSTGNSWIGLITPEEIFKALRRPKRWEASGKPYLVGLPNNQDSAFVWNCQGFF